MSERRWLEGHTTENGILYPDPLRGQKNRGKTDAEVLAEMSGQYTDWCTHHDTHHRPYENNRACRLVPIWIVGMPNEGYEEECGDE